MDKLPKCIKIFEYLLQNAQFTLCLDANFNSMDAELYQMWSSKIPHIVINQHRLDYCKQSRIMLIEDKQLYYSELQKAVDNRQKIVYTSSTKSDLEKTLVLIQTSWMDAKIGVYHGETKQNSELADVNKFWQKYDVLLYNSAVNRGTSYDLPGFDVYFGQFSWRWSSGPKDAHQQLRRVRSVSSGNYYCLIDPTCTNKQLVTRQAVVDSYRQKDTVIKQLAEPLQKWCKYDTFNLTPDDIHYSKYSQNYIINQYNKANNRACFNKILVQELKGEGFQVEFKKKELTHSFDLNSLSEIEMLKNAVDYVKTVEDAQEWELLIKSGDHDQIIQCLNDWRLVPYEYQKFIVHAQLYLLTLLSPSQHPSMEGYAKLCTSEKVDRLRRYFEHFHSQTDDSRLLEMLGTQAREFKTWIENTETDWQAVRTDPEVIQLALMHECLKKYGFPNGIYTTGNVRLKTGQYTNLEKMTDLLYLNHNNRNHNLHSAQGVPKWFNRKLKKFGIRISSKHGLSMLAPREYVTQLVKAIDHNILGINPVTRLFQLYGDAIKALTVQRNEKMFIKRKDLFQFFTTKAPELSRGVTRKEFFTLLGDKRDCNVRVDKKVFKMIDIHDQCPVVICHPNV